MTLLVFCSLFLPINAHLAAQPAIDPLAEGQITGDDLSPAVPHTNITAGKALVAPPGVYEEEHQRRYELHPGLVLLRSKRTFRNRSRFATEVYLRERLPHCRPLHHSLHEVGRDEEDVPISLETTLQEHPTFQEIRYRFIGVPAKSLFELRSEYLCPTFSLAGESILDIPNPIEDTRTIAPINLGYYKDQSFSFHQKRLSYPLEKQAWRWRHRRKFWTFDNRVEALSSLTPTFAFDVSPSTDGPAAAWAEMCAKMLESILERDVHERYSFASVARHIDESHPLQHADLELGMSSRPDSLLPFLKQKRRRLLILIGDGGVSSDFVPNALAKWAKRSGSKILVLNLHRSSTKGALVKLAQTSGGRHLELGDEIASLADFGPRFLELKLEDALRSLRRKKSRGILSKTQIRGADVLELPKAWADALANVPMTLRATPPEQEIFVHVHNRYLKSWDMPMKSAARASRIPKASVLTILRRKVIPKAVKCLRADRKGKLNHSIHAEFNFVIESREIDSLKIKGKLSPELRSCLRSTLEKIHIPNFDAKLNIRYPIYTNAVKDPPAIRLDSELGTTIDRIAAE